MATASDMAVDEPAAVVDRHEAVAQAAALVAAEPPLRPDGTVDVDAALHDMAFVSRAVGGTASAEASRALAPVYALIAEQLQHDGFAALAADVCRAVNIAVPPEPAKPRLHHIVLAALAAHDEPMAAPAVPFDLAAIASADSAIRTLAFLDQPPPPRGLDYGERARVQPTWGQTRTNPNFVPRYQSTNKDPVVSVAFAADGRTAASGCKDGVVKIMDVARIHHARELDQDGTRATTRTYFDHTGPVKDLAFNPRHAILASCSRDATIKLYDFALGTSKKASKAFDDTAPLRSIHFHPSGELLAAGGNQPLLRIFDLNKNQGYVTPENPRSHAAGINSVRWSSDGRLLVSASLDGQIKVWDGMNMRCVRSFPNAHSGTEVNSARISMNSRLLLSCGKDSMVRLWDIGTGRLLRSFTGGNCTQHRLTAEFSSDEEFVVMPDELSNNLIVWDARTGDCVQQLPGAEKLVRCVASSPTESVLLCGGDDTRARFFISPLHRLVA